MTTEYYKLYSVNNYYGIPGALHFMAQSWDLHFHSNYWSVPTGWEQTGYKNGGTGGIGSFWSPSAPWSWGFSIALCALVLPGETWAPRSPDTSFQAHRRNKLQPETTRPTNTRNSQMAKAITETLSIETKDTWHHQNPVLPPQQVLDTSAHHKSKSRI